MNREEIYHDLTALIPEIKRRCSDRVMRETPANFLLDQLIAIQLQEEFDNVFGL